MPDPFEEAADESIQREYARVELEITTGCQRCGRRLLDGDKPTPGSTLLLRRNAPALVLCAECAKQDTPANG